MLVMVLGLEKPRKDFKELVIHHIVTLLLIGLSYRFHFTYIGIAIYVTHDVSDFFLAVSIRVSFYCISLYILYLTPELNDRLANPFNTRTVPSWRRLSLSA